MTLDQYLGQESPIRFPTVLLERDELQVLQTVETPTGRRSLVTIVSGDPLVKELYYLLLGDQLWTMDRDGNPRARSVFQLK